MRSVIGMKREGGVQPAAWVLGLVLGMSAAGGAFAQNGKPAPAPAAKTTPAAVPTEPGATTASYGDWVMRCQRAGGEGGAKPIRVCEAAQTIQVQGQSGPIAQVAVGRVAIGDPLQVTLVLPPNVGLPGSVKILAEEKDAAGFDLPWRRCLPGGCVADAPVREDVLKRWRTAPEPGRIVYKNAAGQEVAIPLSFRGLTQALDALLKEPA